MTPDDKRRERSLRRLLSLIDMSQDLARHDEDETHRHDDGPIHYVIDENILEMFIDPYRFFRHTESFYHVTWFEAGEPAPMQDYESQLALIAAEFILGDSPAALRSSEILISKRHRMEFNLRLEQIKMRIFNTMREWTAEQRKEAVLQHHQKWSAMNAVRFAETARRCDSDLDADLTQMEQAATPVAETTREQVARARVAVAGLIGSESDVLETLEQLSRAVGFDLRRRLRTLEKKFSAKGADLQHIEQESQQWMKRLTAELQRPRHRGTWRAQVVAGTASDRLRAVHGSASSESPDGADARRLQMNALAALASDAYTLAYLRWIVAKLPQGHRLVFITADAVLFDTYRRWYAEAAPGSEPGDIAPLPDEPFVMRRARQYGSLFNFPTVLRRDDQEQLIALIEQALEAPSLAFTRISAGLATAMNPTESRESLMRRRERIALKLVDAERLIDDSDLRDLAGIIDNDWLRDQEDRLADIRSRWRELQRMTIAAAHDLIMARYSGERRKASAIWPPGSAEMDESQAVEYLETLIADVVKKSLAVWEELAQEDGAAAAAVSSEASEPRRLHLGAHLTSIVQLLPKTQREAAVRSSALTFGRAACRALELQDVEHAVRFISLARKASRSAARRPPRTEPHIPGLSRELDYLDAVTCRFLLGNIDAHLIDEAASGESLRIAAIEQMNMLYVVATNLIEECIRAHDLSSDSEFPDNKDYDAVRYLRALSERASLRLFAAATLHFSQTPYRANLADAPALLAMAHQDLLHCLYFDARQKAHDAVLEAARDQFLPNLAAYEVFRCLTVETEDYVFDASLLPVLPRIAEFASRADVHPLLAAELTAFFYLAGQRNHPLSHLDLQALSARTGGPRLALDRVLFQAIRSKILHV